MRMRGKRTITSQTIIFDSERKFGNWGRFTIGLDMNGRAGTFHPEAFIGFDKPADTPAGYTRRSYRVTIPHIKWGKAYRLHILPIYRIQSAAYRKLICG